MSKAVGWEEQRAVQQAAQGREGMHQGSSHWQGKMWLKKLLFPHPTLKGQPLIFLRKGFIRFFLCLVFLFLKMSPFCCNGFSGPEKRGWGSLTVFVSCPHFQLHVVVHLSYSHAPSTFLFIPKKLCHLLTLVFFKSSKFTIGGNIHIVLNHFKGVMFFCVICVL